MRNWLAPGAWRWSGAAKGANLLPQVTSPILPVNVPIYRRGRNARKGSVLDLLDEPEAPVTPVDVVDGEPVRDGRSRDGTGGGVPRGGGLARSGLHAVAGQGRLPGAPIRVRSNCQLIWRASGPYFQTMSRCLAAAGRLEFLPGRRLLPGCRVPTGGRCLEHAVQ